MKKIIVAVCAYLLSFGTNAQELNLPKAQTKVSSFNYSYLQLDINFLHYPIKNVNTNGLSVAGSVVFGDRWATGLALDVTDSRRIAFSRTGISEPNVFEFTQFSLYNELFFHPNSRIDVSLPFKLGIGHATFNPPTDFVFGRTLFSQRNVLGSDYFFMSELGANISIHLMKTLDLNLGSSYRVAWGANGIVMDNDFLNYSLHAGFRFRLAKRK
jgi:hypothetical protein